jgi:drug/metabolite transporter (DMT)-like permease
MDTGPIAPTWFVLPLALIALVLQAGYLIAIRELGPDRMPPSRRRIRVATGWLSMFAIPLSAYGFGIARPSEAGTFTVVWMLVIGLISAIVMLAVLDAINTIRIHRREGEKVHRELRENLQRDLKAIREERDRGGA